MISRSRLQHPAGLILSALLLLAVSSAGLRADDGPPGLTYAKDVAPILKKQCQTCHRPGEAVPLTLMTYSEIRPWTKTIKKAVMERSMPPWHADPAIGKWKNERRLSDAEIKTIADWVDQGAPLGDIRDLPPAPRFEKGWKIGEPDVVLHFPKDEVLPPELEDDYRYVTVKTSFKEDRWLSAVECRPGNVEVVHHIIAFAKAPEPKGGKSAAAQLKGQGERFASLAGGFALIGGMAPGSDPYVMPPGQGILLPAGADIIMQMHYHKEPGSEARDNSVIGFKFAKGKVARQHRTDAVANVLFTIPPNAENHEVSGAMSVGRDMELKTIMPHMHLRGKDFKVWAVYPDGREETLLWIPKYDFNWQTIYEFEKPLLIPQGTKLRGVAHYNNSASNPWNPDPNQRVTFGEPTTSEMMFAFLGFTYADEDLTASSAPAAPGGALLRR